MRNFSWLGVIFFLLPGMAGAQSHDWHVGTASGIHFINPKDFNGYFYPFNQEPIRHMTFHGLSVDFRPSKKKPVRIWLTAARYNTLANDEELNFIINRDTLGSVDQFRFDYKNRFRSRFYQLSVTREIDLKRWRINLGAGAGFQQIRFLVDQDGFFTYTEVDSDGAIETSSLARDFPDQVYEGQQVTAHLLARVAWQPIARVWVSAGVQYRYASIRILREDGDEIILSPISSTLPARVRKLSFQASGYVATFGVKYALIKNQ